MQNRARVQEAVQRQQQRRRQVRITVSAVAAVAVVAAGAVGFQLLRGGGGAALSAPGVAPDAPTTQLVASGCSRPAELTVAVPAAMAPAFTEIVGAFNAQPGVPCASFTVVPREASTVAQSMAGPTRPDAWVTDAGLWLEQANRRAGLGLVADEPFAASPVLLAMGGDAAEDAEGSGWAELARTGPDLVLPDPATSTVGLLTLSASAAHWSEPVLRQVAESSRSVRAGDSALVAASDGRRDVATPVSRAELVAYNTTNPRSPLAAVAPSDGAPALEYSLVAVADGTVASRVLRSLRDFLASDAARAVVARHGFTPPGEADTPQPSEAATPASAGVGAPATTTVRGTVKTLAPPALATVEKLRDTWAALQPAPQAILALDTSATTLGRLDGETILDRITEAAQVGIATLPDRSKVGVWLYGQHLGPKGEDHRALVSPAALSGAGQLQAIAKGLGSMSSVAGGGRGLYDTVIAAVGAARAQAQPGRANTAVVVTAGPNDDDFGASLGAVKAALGKTASGQGVHLVIIGVGAKPDATVLTEVAAAAGGSYRAVQQGNELAPAISAALAGRL
ncbi:substrate-binding and VWA domain-containing protein [Intrasporangium sp. DVR]|uniref:substrate-binding and VWA domain-containing protein n=1 Tax=Intrasporangium sp. DVR TaxID=3127867 RepID=UPI00313A556F